MVPKVRTWRVRFYDEATLLKDVAINTVNKRFARWLANEQNGYPSFYSTRIVVSLVKKG